MWQWQLGWRWNLWWWQLWILGWLRFKLLKRVHWWSLLCYQIWFWNPNKYDSWLSINKRNWHSLWVNSFICQSHSNRSSSIIYLFRHHDGNQIRSKSLIRSWHVDATPCRTDCLIYHIVLSKLIALYQELSELKLINFLVRFWNFW